MSRRALVIRVGDHWFLRHVRDLYETLAYENTTNDQPRGILSIFPTQLPSPFSAQTTHVEDTEPRKNTSYLKDEESIRAFTEDLSDAELKIYIAGHCHAGANYLSSLESNSALQFTLSVQAIARKIHGILTTIKAKPSPQKPISINLISCYAASSYNSTNKRSSFAVKLLEELHTLGHQHILINASDKTIAAPFFGKTYTNGTINHFYLAENTIYNVEKKNDHLHYALTIIKKCKQRTSVPSKYHYLKGCLTRIGNEIGYPTKTEQLGALRNIISQACNSREVNQYSYGTGWFMSFFGLKTNTRKELDKVNRRLENATETYDTVQNYRCLSHYAD